MTPAAVIAKAIIRTCQVTPLRGTAGYSAERMRAKGDARAFPLAETERDRFGDLFKYFREGELAAAVRGKDVLDYGCGYGGKTVEYCRQSGARLVWGVEPYKHVIDLCDRYLASTGVTGVVFRTCTQDHIPLSDDSVDLVVSHDVLEHVDNPFTSMREIRRVLKPGGAAFLVFPVYLGAMSHHLDYVARLPGLHWLFPACTLVEAANAILVERPDIATAPQPPPARSFDGARDVLPSLNGLSGEHLPEICQGFEVVSLKRNPLLYHHHRAIAWFTRPLTRLPGVRLKDMFTWNVSAVLRKPAGEPARAKA